MKSKQPSAKLENMNDYSEDNKVVKNKTKFKSKKEDNGLVVVRAKKLFFDLKGQIDRNVGDKWQTSKDRASKLRSLGFVDVL